VYLRVDGGAEARHRHEAGEIGQLAGSDERQQHWGQWGHRRGGRAAEEEEEVPAEEKGFLEIVGHPGALRRSR
jgi:hypothetical protein